MRSTSSRRCSGLEQRHGQQHDQRRGDQHHQPELERGRQHECRRSSGRRSAHRRPRDTTSVSAPNSSVSPAATLSTSPVGVRCGSTWPSCVALRVTIFIGPYMPISQARTTKVWLSVPAVIADQDQSQHDHAEPDDGRRDRRGTMPSSTTLPTTYGPSAPGSHSAMLVSEQTISTSGCCRSSHSRKRVGLRVSGSEKRAGAQASARRLGGGGGTSGVRDGGGKILHDRLTLRAARTRQLTVFRSRGAASGQCRVTRIGCMTTDANAADESSEQMQGVAGATDDGRVYVVTPQAMAVEGPPRERSRDRAGDVGDRHGRAAGQGDADRQHDPPAARRGEVGAAGRRQPAAAAQHPRRPRSPSSRTGWRPSWSRSWSGSRCRSATTPPRAMPSCGSPRPSWSAGWRGCSTASRPPCSPSRWPPAPSSSRCAGRCRPAPRSRPVTRTATSPAAGACTCSSTGWALRDKSGMLLI